MRLFIKKRNRGLKMDEFIRLDEKFAIALISAQFKQLKINWARSFLSWCIDSKYRKYKRVDAFLNEQLLNPDSTLVETAKKFRELPPDQAIIGILKFVYEKVTYIPDLENYQREEYWTSAAQTLERKRDDCDGINGLIYVMARIAGIPNYLLYSVLGETTAGYHYWLWYFSPTLKKGFSIDGTFYPDFRLLSERTPFVVNTSRYLRVDYVFNDAYAFQPIIKIE